MVLLFNVFLTNSQGNRFIKFDRGTLKSSSKLDITKYCLSSLSVIPFKKVILNIELDKAFYNDTDYNNLENFIYEEFTLSKIIFNKRRNINQMDWINTYKEIQDEKLVFLLCNHDHIFINSDLDWINYISNISYHNEYTFSMSHWVESVRCAKSGYIQLNETTPKNLHKNYLVKDNHVEYDNICLDSLNIITNDIYKNWFLEGDWGNFELPRVDGIGNGNIIDIKNFLGLPLINQKIIVPYKEQFRHFDGYIHQLITNDVCPALSIPDGFFENDIKIRYGYEDYKYGWVNINPKKDKYRAVDINGTDDKITITDIPLFWQKRISEMDINKDILEEEMIQYRLKAVLEQLYFDVRYNPYISKELESKVLKEYLKTYKVYNIDN